MAETPVSAQKSTPLKRLLLNLNNPDEEPDKAVLLADLPDTDIGWELGNSDGDIDKNPDKNSEKNLSTNNDKEQSSSTSSIENNVETMPHGKSPSGPAAAAVTHSHHCRTKKMPAKKTSTETDAEYLDDNISEETSSDESYNATPKATKKTMPSQKKNKSGCPQKKK
jgi:hypothetical protein